MLKRALTYLGVIFAIFLRDVKRIVRNPVALILTLGICVMPSAYAWYCIEANWNPYQNTGNMKVAVANADKGFESDETGTINVGDEVVAKLKDNHQLDWVFTDEKDAVDGVYSGAYWAALVMPENFSRDFASVLTGDFTKPQLDYYVNEKISSSAPEITNTGAQTVQNAINDAFVGTVSEKVATATQTMGEAAQQKGDASETALTSGVDKARKAIGQTRQTLGELQTTMETAATSVQAAADSLASLDAEVPQLTDSIATSRKLLEDTRAAVNSQSASFTKNATDAALSISSAAASAQRALGTVSGNVSQAESDTAAALAGAQRLLKTNQQLIDTLRAQGATNPTISDALNTLEGYNQDLTNTTNAPTTLSDDLTATASALEQAASTLNTTAENGSSAVQKGADTFQTTVVPSVDQSLDAFADACGTLQGALAGLTPTLHEAQAQLASLKETITSSTEALKTTSDSLATTEESLGNTLTDLTALQGSDTVKKLADYLKTSPGDIGSFMAAPVTLKTVDVYPVRNYGSGVAPFFTNLGLWAGGFVLIAIVRVRVDPAGLPRFTAVQGYFGRWLFYVVTGLLQALVVCGGDLLLGIQCESPAAFLGAGLFTAFVDMNLIYALFYAFRHIGKALAVIILIMQIPGSSGMYPVEMMPTFFQIINPLLPFTYSIDAMREAIGGFYGLHYLEYLLKLSLFSPVGLAIGLGIGLRAGGLNYLFDKKLGQTSLLLTEDAPQDAPVLRSRMLLHALLDTPAYHERIVGRAQRFLTHYKPLERVGWVALFAQPAITMAVMVLLRADVDTKILLIGIMVVGIIVVDAYLIIISYLKIRAERVLSMAQLSPDDLASQLRDQMAGPKGGAA